MRFKRHTRIKVANFGKMGKKNQWKMDMLCNMLNANDKILDVGSAVGNLANYIPTTCDYYGIDYNDNNVAFGRDKGLKLYQCDLSEGKLPFGNEMIDVIWFSHVIEHLQCMEQVKIMQEIYRILKPGGVVIVFAPTAYNLWFWDNCTHVRPCTHGQLETLALDCGFNKVDGRYSLVRWFPNSWQRFIRLVPFVRQMLWECFMVAEK